MASIYPNFKDGKIISFKFKAYLGKDEKGKQIFKCKTWIPEKQLSKNKLISLAEKEATLWELELSNQGFNISEESPCLKITFKDFVNDIWFPSQMNEEKCRITTISFHKDILKTVFPFMGQTLISELDSKQIKNYLDYLKNIYRTKNNKRLSPKTIRHHYSTINLIMSYAEKEGYISFNPVKNIDVPKLVKQRVNALTKEQVISFMEEVEKLPLMQRTMYNLLLTTGIRRGECYGLKWQDIDLRNMVIRVERSVTYTNNHGLSVGPPKTNMSIRDIPLTKHTTSLLSEYKTRLNSIYTVKHDMYVFPSVSSPYEPHNPSYITKHMKKFMKKIGLPDMSPHDLRHTCASLLLQSGADIKSVQDILGHADASTTLNYYAKSDINVMRLSAQRAFDV